MQPLFDLSGDPDAEVSNHSFSVQQLLHERVIKKVLKKCEIYIEVTDKLRIRFKSKLWRMGQSLAKVGGTKRQIYAFEIGAV